MNLVFPDVGLREGPSVGLRFDASESVALKFQYDYTAFAANRRCRSDPAGWIYVLAGVL